MDNATDILKKYWGFDSFRSPQEEIIQNILSGHNTIALLPTGGGKSICYQIPAILFDGKTIVISPLIALMQDQVIHLRQKGIKARCIHSALNYYEIDRILDEFVYGDLKILYIAPERIQSESFYLRIQKVKLSLIAVDEAHCISQWGYDFRPAYFTIPDLKLIHPKTPILALTATATDKVLHDIQSKLALHKPKIFKKSFVRENLSISIIHSENKNGELLRIIQRVQGSKIIYTRNRKNTIEIAQWLQHHNIHSTSYHGGMDKDLRENNQRDWMQNRSEIMVATNAFGMGIDKPDVRMVIHLDIASSIEEYYQEAGRAGRDGLKSYAVLIYNDEDIASSMLDWQDQYPEINFIAKVYDILCRYYEIPYGTGAGNQYVFSIVEFSEYCSIPVKRLYLALQILEKERWITLSDGFHNPSTVIVIADHTQLEFQGANHILREQVFTHLLRKYEGLFVQPTKIDENRIGKDLNLPTDKVIVTLKQLHFENVIIYTPQNIQPMVTFINDRVEPLSFDINREAYSIKKNLALTRLQAVHQLIQDNNRCRQQSIVEYFGENVNVCGTCDYCIASKMKTLSQQQKSKLLQHIKQNLGQNGLDLQKYIHSYPANRRNIIAETIYHFSNERIIYIDKNGRIQNHDE